MTYVEIKEAIENAPITWLPGLLRATIEASIKKAVFLPSGLRQFVQNVIERAEAER